MAFQNALCLKMRPIDDQIQEKLMKKTPRETISKALALSTGSLILTAGLAASPLLLTRAITL